ncbi:uncharacterized protein LOC144136276 isoform X2 [Amblyomma americanum]
MKCAHPRWHATDVVPLPVLTIASSPPPHWEPRSGSENAPLFPLRRSCILLKPLRGLRFADAHSPRSSARFLASSHLGRASSRRRGSGERSRGGRSAGSPFAAFSAMAASRRAVPARSRCTQTDPLVCCCASYPPASANGDRSWFLEGPLRPSAPPLPPATSTDLLRLAEPPDVRLVVGPERGGTRSFQVHAAILKHSAVLEDLLGRSTRECDGRAACGGPENDSSVVRQPTRTLRVIWDDPGVFEKMILSLYGRDVPLEDVSSALELLRVSHAFAVPGLMSVCLRYVGDHVDRESALSTLTRLCEVSGGGGAAVDLQQNLLNETRARCLDVVDQHAERLLAAADFERLPRELVALVLARDTLWLRSEMSAVEGADRWAAAECRRRGEAPCAALKRRALGDAAYLVRHFRLDRDQFRRAPALLDDSEAGLVLDFLEGRIGEEQLTPALRANLALRQRPSLPSSLPPPSSPVDTEQSAPANGRLRSQTMARTRKSTSAKVRKCAAEVFWTFVSILD